MRILWTSVFLDVPADAHARSTAFWAAVTGTSISSARGEEGEFTSLLPATGDGHIRIQRVADGEPRLHLDLHVDDPGAAAAEAVALGASVLAEPGYVVLASPGGFTFCLVAHRAETPAPAARWDHGHLSAVDQVCLDVAPAAYDTELTFWSALTGWTRTAMQRPEFVRLDPAAGLPLQLLIQRLDTPDEGDQRVRAHLDLGVSTGGRDAEVERHVALGARVQGHGSGWTVLVDPAAMAYCVTDHPPRHG